MAHSNRRMPCLKKENNLLANCATVNLPLTSTTTSATSTTTLHILSGKPGKISLRKCNGFFNQKHFKHKLYLSTSSVLNLNPVRGGSATYSVVVVVVFKVVVVVGAWVEDWDEEDEEEDGTTGLTHVSHPLFKKESHIYNSSIFTICENYLKGSRV